MSYSWMNVLIKSSASLLDALKVIDSEGLQIALVVNDAQELQGVVTDGDIRRGILKGLALNTSVAEVMNTSPITARVTTSKDELVSLMETNHIISIPVLDLDTKKVIGLESIHHQLKNEVLRNPIFIMAGGFGTRLSPLTDSCPKPMLEIGGRPILETVIRNFVKSGFVNFFISTHYMPEQIHDYFGDGSAMGVNIKYVHEDVPLGTGGALGLLSDDLQDGLPLIMINGDVLTKVDFQRLLSFHNENNADATMCVREYDYQIPYGVINGEGNKIVSMEEKPTQRFFVNAGVYVVSPQVYKSVPKNHRVDMPSLLEQHIEKGKQVLMFPIHEYWLDIGRMDDFNRAKSDIYSLGLL